jgi:hypothetical protein
MNFKALLCTAILVSLNVHAYCSTNVTLVVGGSVTNASLTVGAGQLAKVVYVFLGEPSIPINANGGTSALLTITVGPNSFAPYYFYSVQSSSPDYGIFPHNGLPVVSGPAAISLQAITASGGFCTIEVTNPEESFVPSSSVVIPADSGGPVTLVLESSMDLITWTAALPGTYGTSTTNRFFRVRAVRGP